jgi:hypothetical protein
VSRISDAILRPYIYQNTEHRKSGTNLFRLCRMCRRIWVILLRKLRDETVDEALILSGAGS